MGFPTRIHATAVLAAIAPAALSFALAACTAGNDTLPPAQQSPSTSPPPVTSTDSYVFTDAAGIEARLKLHDEGAVLTIVNDTGSALPRAGVFVLDARDGARTDWTVLGARDVPGGRSEWQVERPPVPEAKHIGLVVMLFGGEDYGAFVPPASGSGV